MGFSASWHVRFMRLVSPFVSLGFLDRFPLSSVPLSNGFPATQCSCFALVSRSAGFCHPIRGDRQGDRRRRRACPAQRRACANRPGRFARTLGLTSTLSRFFSLCMGMHGRRRRARGALKSPRRRACAAGVARCAQNPVETLGATLRAMRQKHRGCGSQQSGLNMSGRFALRVRLGRAREVSVRQTGGQKAWNQRRESLYEARRIHFPGPGMGGNGLGMQGAAAETPAFWQILGKP